MITRIAPTPSGFLHLGNCVNVTLIDAWARANGARVVLRIDDIDADRYRREYVEDIFRVLQGLGIAWESGPTSVDEFEAQYSMRAKANYYRAQLDQVREGPIRLFACECSRSDLHAAQSTTCVQNCADRGLQLAPGRTSLRARITDGAAIHVGGVDVDPQAELGDFVVWRRDDQPSYQLASVIEDRDLGITHVIRGADLIPSTAAQLLLADALGADSVRTATFLHHRLVTGDDGAKLSKSQLTAGPLDLTDQTRSAIAGEASRLRTDIGLAAPIDR